MKTSHHRYFRCAEAAAPEVAALVTVFHGLTDETVPLGYDQWTGNPRDGYGRWVWMAWQPENADAPTLKAEIAMENCPDVSDGPVSTSTSFVRVELTGEREICTHFGAQVLSALEPLGYEQFS